MNVAFFVDSFPKLTQTFILNQITGLIDTGHDVTVFALQSVDEAKKHAVIKEYDLLDRTVYVRRVGSYQEGLAVLTECLPSVLATYPRALSRAAPPYEDWTDFPWNVRKLHRCLVEAESFDICHAHFGPVGNQFLPVFETADTPVVVSFYGYDASRRLAQDPTHYDALFSQADAVTTVSDYMSDKIVEAGCPAQKVVKQPLAVDTSQFDFHERAPNDECISIVSVSRMVEKKGLKYAIEAIGGLVADYELKYQIIGDGHLRDEIERQIASLEIEDTVELLGWQEQERTADIMRNAELFVLPSVTAADGDEEGTPTVLLEAQAMGLPVVSTYHAGIPEIVADGESGLLVPERNADELQAAIQTLLDNPDWWEELGRHGSERIETEHSIPAVAERLERIYHRLG